MADGFTKIDDDGNLYGVGALSWFTTFLTNTDQVPELPTTWADLWTRDWDGRLGLTLNSDSRLMEATAQPPFLRLRGHGYARRSGKDHCQDR